MREFDADNEPRVEIGAAVPDEEELPPPPDARRMTYRLPEEPSPRRSFLHRLLYLVIAVILILAGLIAYAMLQKEDGSTQEELTLENRVTVMEQRLKVLENRVQALEEASKR